MKQKPRYYLGLDPGKKGGWAILLDGDILDCGSFHNFEYKECLTKNLDFFKDAYKLGEIEVIVIIEQVGARPKQNVKSIFTFGAEFGHLIGRIKQCELPHFLVLPQKWQKFVFEKLGFEDTKDASLRVAAELFPDFAHKFKRTSIDHGTSDAVLLAWYGWKNRL